MIKSVLFDWFNTLTCYDPPREELYRRVFRENGIEVSLQDIYKGLLVGDRNFFNGNVRARVRKFSPEDRARAFMVYTQGIAESSGIVIPAETQFKVIQGVLRIHTGKYALFQDVLPTFQQLKDKNLKLGIITNADKNVADLIASLGLRPWLDVLVTSEQVGVEKPDKEIFLAALKELGIQASEAVYTGDQYQSDVLGAANVGIKALFLDRYDACPELSDHPRIKSLSEITGYL